MTRRHRAAIDKGLYWGSTSRTALLYGFRVGILPRGSNLLTCVQDIVPQLFRLVGMLEFFIDGWLCHDGYELSRLCRKDGRRG